MELFDLYTAEREKTGKTMVRGDRTPEGYYRLVVHVCIFDREGRMLIQQRQPFKQGWSNLWDISVGGSAVAGDSSRSAAERETLEELRGMGYELAIVSNCQRGYVEAFLHSSGMADLFCDYEEWERTGLTKGENIRLVMERNGYRKAVYVGDTRKDQEAAQAAGIPFIHASYGFGETEGPDGVIASLTDLPSLIRRGDYKKHD